MMQNEQATQPLNLHFLSHDFGCERHHDSQPGSRGGVGGKVKAGGGGVGGGGGGSGSISDGGGGVVGS